MENPSVSDSKASQNRQKGLSRVSKTLPEGAQIQNFLGSMAKVVDYLSSKHKALSSKPSTTKKE
jgi:hypothetical protein